MACFTALYVPADCGEGHLLWNAARTIAAYLEDHADNLIAGRDILELGAGAGLPSLVCASNGARRVVVTDYPDLDLIENLTFNVENCGLRIEIPVYTEGFLWGTAPDKLLAHLDNNYAGFDIVVLADLLFNHSEHSKLVSSVQQTLKKSATARALVFFTPYRPWLLAKDMAFFDIVQDAGLVVTKVLEMTMEKVMFEEDPGDERLRRTVFGYELSWREHC